MPESRENRANSASVGIGESFPSAVTFGSGASKQMGAGHTALRFHAIFSDSPPLRNSALCLASIYYRPERLRSLARFEGVPEMSVRERTAAFFVAGVLVVSQASIASAAVSVDPGSSSGADGRVQNAVQIGGDLYVGGLFTSVDGQTETRLAALNASTGVLDPGFNVAVNGEVTSLAASGTTLYLAGNFTMVGSVARTNLASIDTITGEVLGFNVNPSAVVQSVDVQDGVVYFGGNFSMVNGASQRYLAAVDATTGALIPSFNPKLSARVYVVKATSSGIYVGGRFQTIAGVARNYVALLTSAGTAQTWDAGLGFDSQVLDLIVDSGHVYLGTGGHLPAGNSAYSIDATTGERQWQVQTDGNIQAVEAADGTVYVGGHFNYLKPCSADVCVASQVRQKALAVEAMSGAILPWSPKINSSLGVWDLTAANGNLYALGDFTVINRATHLRIARFTL